MHAVGEGGKGGGHDSSGDKGGGRNTVWFRVASGLFWASGCGFALGLALALLSSSCPALPLPCPASRNRNRNRNRGTRGGNRIRYLLFFVSLFRLPTIAMPYWSLP